MVLVLGDLECASVGCRRAVVRLTVADGGDAEAATHVGCPGVTERGQRAVPRELLIHLIETLFERLEIAIESSGIDGRPCERLFELFHPVKTDLECFVCSGYGAPQLGNLRHVDGGFGRRGPFERSGEDTDHLERHRTGEGGDLAVHPFGKTHGVFTGRGHVSASSPVPRIRCASDLFDGLGCGVAEIPGDAVKALLGGRGDGPNHGAFGIAHRQEDLGLRLPAFGLEGVVADVGSVLPFLLELLFCLATLLLKSGETVAEVVGEDRPVWRIVGHVEGPTLGRLAAFTERPALDVPQGVPTLKEDRLLLEGLCAEVAQRGVVVKDKETAAEGGAHEVVLPPLNGEIAE